MASSHLARSVEDVQTELLLQTFADRILLLITQVGKVGSLVRRDPNGPQPSIDVALSRLDSSIYPPYSITHPNFRS
jgi:proteasome assembly chaperone 3